jgi:Tfp pilus assembly PilM family ATPase
MSTVLYLSNQQIQVVVGSAGNQKLAVQQAYTADAPEGTIINGMVMDTDAFVEFIKSFWAQYKLPAKDITLVINSSKFVGKTIELPKLSDSKTLAFIDREFASIRKEEDEIYAYMPLASSDKNVRRIYAESISSEFIKEYLDIFGAAGVGIKRICSGESSLISFTNMTVATKYHTFLMVIADNMTLTTLLWVNGSFYQFNNTRCFHERGTEEYAMDVARSVSQIVQFMQAHQIEQRLEAVLLAGIPDVQSGIYQMALSGQGIDIPVTPFDSDVFTTGSTDVQSHLHAASGLVSNGKWHNFLNQYGAKKQKKNSVGGTGKGIMAVVAVFGVMLVATVACYLYRLSVQHKLDALEEEINSPLVLEQIDEYDELLVRNSFLTRQYNAIKDIDDNIYSYPVCDNDIIKVIDNCSGNYATVRFESFDANSGLVSVSAQSDTVDNINKFIKSLNEQEIFKKIDYTGYSYDSNTELWDIHVTCTLVEAAGR